MLRRDPAGTQQETRLSDVTPTNPPAGRSTSGPNTQQSEHLFRRSKAWRADASTILDADTFKSGREWIRRARLRALAWVLAILIAAIATITFGGLPWVPVIGAALATAAVSVSKLTTKLLQPTCLACGRDLSGEPIGIQGIACPDCGSVQMPNLVDLARLDRRQSEQAGGDETEEV